jgi:hypothetical protein
MHNTQPHSKNQKLRSAAVLKSLLITAALFITSIVIALVCEENYRQLVRYLFTLFNGNNILFIGKNFHLFPSESFILSFALFTSLTFWAIKLAQLNTLKTIAWTFSIFFATTLVLTALDSGRLVLEFTACKDGIRRLSFNQPTYDLYFILSWTAASIYVGTKYLAKRKQLTIKDNESQSR